MDITDLRPTHIVGVEIVEVLEHSNPHNHSCTAEQHCTYGVHLCHLSKHNSNIC